MALLRRPHACRDAMGLTLYVAVVAGWAAVSGALFFYNTAGGGDFTLLAILCAIMAIVMGLGLCPLLYFVCLGGSEEEDGEEEAKTREVTGTPPLEEIRVVATTSRADPIRV